MTEKEKERLRQLALRNEILKAKSLGVDTQTIKRKFYEAGADMEAVDEELGVMNSAYGQEDKIQDDLDTKAQEKLGTGTLLQQYYTNRSLVENIKKYREEYLKVTEDNKLLPTEIAGENSAKLKAMYNDIIFQVAQSEGTGALQEADRKIVEDMLPDVSTSNPIKIGGQLLRGGRKGNEESFNTLMDTFKRRIEILSGEKFQENNALDQKTQPNTTQEVKAQPVANMKAEFDRSMAYAKANPNDPNSQKFIEMVNSGKIDSDTGKLIMSGQSAQNPPYGTTDEGLQKWADENPEAFDSWADKQGWTGNTASRIQTQPTEPKETTVEKVGDFIGATNLAKGAGSALFLNSAYGKELQRKAQEGDKASIEALKEVMNETPTGKEIIGSAALTALNILTFGSAGEAKAGIAATGKLIGKEGIKQVAKGAGRKILENIGLGGLYGAAGAAEQDKNLEEGIKETAISAGVGGAISSLGVGLSKMAKDRLAELPGKTQRAVRQIIQGETKDQEKALRALQTIDTANVKNYEELRNVINKENKNLGKVMDIILSRDPTQRKLNTLAEVTKVGGKKVKTNYVKQSLNNLQELYKSTNSPADLQRIKNLAQKANKQGLTIKEINDIAKEYGIEFGEKAFSKLGDPRTSVNSVAYENTRKGVKKTLRTLFPDTISQKIDEQFTNNLNTQRLVKKMVEKVNNLEQKIDERKLSEKFGRAVGKAFNAIPVLGGGARGILQSFVPSNAGNKMMNAIALQDALESNLRAVKKPEKFVDKLSKMLEEKSRRGTKITQGVVQSILQ
ncbi:hypothetical protein KJ912_02475, partial [Patescibacteria group bacterium]|nr:hypothetical protein [Patescibacteria group bacterium]